MRALLSLPLLTLAGSGLEFSPKQDTKLSKTFETTLSLEGGDLEVIMSGQPVPAEYLPVIEIELQTETTVAFTDRYVSVADGCVVGLVRSYDELGVRETGLTVMSGQGMDNEVETDGEGTSELSGEHVRFTYDEEEGAFEVGFERGEGSDGAELLKGLNVHADWIGILPDEGVEKGDSWTVKAAAVSDLFDPSGHLPFEYAEGDPRNGADPGVTTYEGQLDVTVSGIHSRDGQELITFAVEGEIEKIITSPTDLAHIPVVDGMGTQINTHIMTLEGEVVWNATTGHGVSMQLEGPVEATMRTEKDSDSGTDEFISTVYLNGEVSYSATFEPAD